MFSKDWDGSSADLELPSSSFSMTIRCDVPPHQNTDRTESNIQQQYHAGPMHMPSNHYPSFPPPGMYPQVPGYPWPQYQIPGPYDPRFRTMIPPGHPHVSDPNTQQSDSSQPPSSMEESSTMTRGDVERPLFPPQSTH